MKRFTGENAGLSVPITLVLEISCMLQKEESSILFCFRDVLKAESKVIWVCVREIERGIFLTQLEPGEMPCN